MNGADEPAHFDYVQRLGEDLRLPSREPGCTGYSAENRAVTATLEEPIKFRPSRPMPPLRAFVPPDPRDPASRATMGCGVSGPYPPLYYASAAVAYRIERDAPFLQRFFAARLVSVGWGMLTAFFAFLLGVTWFGRARDGALLGTIVSAQPMIAHLAASVNNDAAVTACAAGAFAAVAMLAKDRTDRRAFLLLLATTLVGGFSKPLFGFILPVLGVGTAFALGPRRLGSWLRSAALLAPSALVMAGWSIHTRFISRLPSVTDTRPYLEVAKFSFGPGRLYVIWHKTFWMCWGWLDTWLDDGYYSALALVMVLAAAGFVLAWRRLDLRDRWLFWFATAGSLAIIASFQVVELMIVRRVGQMLVQGRYLLPFFPVQALALVTCLRSLSRRLGSWMDGGWAFAGMLLVVDAASIARALVRYYA
jgi:4-amino-4-deoxy-L-arabinose transferase-like glycosyltransferase